MAKTVLAGVDSRYRCPKSDRLLEGQAIPLELLLTKRFGTLTDDIYTRLKSATTDYFKHWACVVLDVLKLNAVFAAH